MESFALLRGGLPSKLPLLKPSPSTPMSVMPSWLCFNVRNPPFPRLSNGSVLTCVSIGLTRNPNIHDKLLARCGDGVTYSNAEEDSLKALLSLVQPKESNSSTLVIASTKNEALKLVVEGKYGEALCHTKNLCSFAKAEVVYEARLAHLQILIRLDEYDKALEFLEEDNFPQSFEARLSLYKAVVHTMLGNGDKAEEWWNTYLETLGSGNVNEELKAHCRNTNSDGFLMNAKSLLKPLLSLKSLNVGPDSLLFNIIPFKKMALKEVVNEDYDAAKRHMENLCNKVRDSREEALEAQIAYLHILIYLGKYEEALKRLVAIEEDFHDSNLARPCLYKAIGLTALGNHKDAKICWKCFMKTIGVFNPFEHQTQ
ncbi:uncharacterized protein LOC111457322 isoform X1 [Cucurbita moschata]|uniref:Uncharacterized protein LOC111457322 isoform X1 n=1 Tax=Cucurbita moschata TaxID=3662 RepID=A0A6J1GT93_CUCMO|nr:uncharacterized protein LOC111457322 isoform X1 [Cucurbita moschata]XP_022955327.1 uncharacterized protein LOC111457322 isoform X1 [Cucurbita moschata]